MAGDSETAVAQLEALVPSLRPAVPELIDELSEHLQQLMPEYSHFLGEHRAEVTMAAEEVVCTLVRIAQQALSQNASADTVVAGAADPNLFEQIGRMQWRQGIPIGTLLAAYRLGDSPMNVITPLMVYLPFIVIVAQRYKKSAGLGTIVALMLPYTAIVLVTWVLFFLVWYLLGIPIGPGYPAHI